MAILRTEGISKSYLGEPTIVDVNMALKAGEIVGLLGVSGAGKSTLFNIIAGILQPDSGRVLLDGRDITGEPGHISYMQQKDLLLPFKTVLDNTALPLVLHGMPLQEARQTASARFAQFGIDGAQSKYPAQLSGGMRQRAALLRTHLTGSKVALLDEPFSALDAITRRAMQKWYLGLIDQLGLTTVFITHDVEEALVLSDRIYIMTQVPGRIDHELVIEPPRPRPDDFVTTPAFVAYKREIMQLLHL